MWYYILNCKCVHRCIFLFYHGIAQSICHICQVIESFVVYLYTHEHKNRKLLKLGLLILFQLSKDSDIEKCTSPKYIKDQTSSLRSVHLMWMYGETMYSNVLIWFQFEWNFKRRRIKTLRIQGI